MLWAKIRALWIPTSDQLIAKAQATLLERTLASADLEVELKDVPTGDGQTIHTVACSRKGSSQQVGKSATPVLLIHGYFLGSGCWSENLQQLSDDGRQVFAIDWPGWGRSSRPAFPIGQGVDAVETFFVDRIEAWRKSMGVSKMVLLGHSFGGYFAACYAMKHPQHVEALILASPVGMGDKTPGNRLSDPAKRAELPLWQRGIVRVLESMWHHHVTPQSVIRLGGPFGWRLARWYVTSRFRGPREANTMEVDSQALHQYMYHLAAQPACSEKVLSEVLEFGIWAKNPMAARLAEHLKSLGSQAPSVALLYGQKDWMDPASGVWLARQLGAKAAGGRNDVIQVEGAGHQLHLDHPRAFNLAVQRTLGKGPPEVEGMYSTLHAA